MAEASGLHEFVAAYVLEVEEHLETASSQLLSVEAALRSGGANLKGVREAFRSLHTIKGLSSMVGVEPIVTIAHRMEAILRSSDRQGVKLRLDAIDVLLNGLRSIRALVRQFSEAKSVAAPPADLIRALDLLDTESAPPAPSVPALDLEPALAAKLGPLELEQLETGLTRGQRALRIEFEPSVEKATRGVTINQVRERLQQLGEVVKIFPVSKRDEARVGSGLTFVIVLLSTASSESLAEAAGVHAAAVQLLSAPAPPMPLRVVDTLLDDSESASAQDEAYVPQRGVVRVEVSRLDETVDGLSALIVTRFRLARAVKLLREQGIDTRELDAVVTDTGRQLKTLRTAILRVRMVPIAELLDRVPLIVRSLRRSTNRLVRVELDSGGAELDKSVAERLFPALVHLVRNAVDHAIETPDERERRGKPEEGLVRIGCSSRSNRWLEMRVTDDGRGIDAEAVARRARAPVPSSAAGLLALVCRSGLSTRDVASTLSGRGMGMEIVKRIVTEQLGGELSLDTQLGKGTTFTLTVPLSISVIDAFSFICGGQRFVTPVGAVEEIVQVEAASLVEGPNRDPSQPLKLVRHRGRAVPLLSLATVFALRSPAAEDKALIVRRGEDAVAFAVDRMLGQQEVVLRPLTDALVNVPGVSGATDLGDGQPTLVLDLFSLAARLLDPERGAHP